MKKILEKVKKRLFAIGIFLTTLPTRVLAADVPVPMYGVEKPKEFKTWNKISNVWNSLKFFIVPLIVVIGIMGFWKKSKKSTRRKMIVLVLVLIIIVLIYFEVDVLFNLDKYRDTFGRRMEV